MYVVYCHGHDDDGPADDIRSVCLADVLGSRFGNSRTLHDPFIHGAMRWMVLQASSSRLTVPTTNSCLDSCTGKFHPVRPTIQPVCSTAACTPWLTHIVLSLATNQHANTRHTAVNRQEARNKKDQKKHTVHHNKAHASSLHCIAALHVFSFFLFFVFFFLFFFFFFFFQVFARAKKLQGLLARTIWHCRSGSEGYRREICSRMNAFRG